MAAANVPLPELSPLFTAKLRSLQEKLGTDDLATALDKSLNIASFIADTVHDPDRKLLVESDGKFMELKTIL